MEDLIYEQVRKQYDEERAVREAKNLVIAYVEKKRTLPSGLELNPSIDEKDLFIVSLNKVGESSAILLRTTNPFSRNVFEVIHDAAAARTEFNVYMQVNSTTIPDTQE